MMSQQAPNPPVASERPFEFRSISEEVAMGTVMGGVVSGMVTLVTSGLVGSLGAYIGKVGGDWSTLGGAAIVWLVFWLIPLAVLMPRKPLWRIVVVACGGAMYLSALHWHIYQRYLGDFYPWIVSALPFGIVLGAWYEPIRLAQGGNTEEYAQEGWIVTGSGVTFGNRAAMLLFVGHVVGLIADIVSFGRQRIGGLISGGVIGLIPSSIVAWRGDLRVADAFWGSVWNIAWAGTTIGAIAGATSGLCAALIRERQQQRHQALLEKDNRDASMQSTAQTDTRLTK